MVRYALIEEGVRLLLDELNANCPVCVLCKTYLDPDGPFDRLAFTQTPGVLERIRGQGYASPDDAQDAAIYAAHNTCIARLTADIERMQGEGAPVSYIGVRWDGG